MQVDLYIGRKTVVVVVVRVRLVFLRVFKGLVRIFVLFCRRGV